MKSDFSMEQYLDRIGLCTSPRPNDEGLQAIHSAQAFSIPFENLDIHLGRKISLDPGDLTAKMLQRRRGGYCFELNGLLRLALKAAGFNVRPVMARVLYGRPDPGARTHNVLVVSASGREWLADVGFGGPGLRLPIPLEVEQIFEQYGDRYRLRREPIGIVLQKESRDSFLDLYAFNLEELTLDIDIEMGNHFTSTWPQSIFKLRRMCSLPKPWGRITLSDMELTVCSDKQSTSRILPAGSEYMNAISENFGITVDAVYQELAPLTSS
jgi:N-hydroxyarylamine O-acetyltransferase